MFEVVRVGALTLQRATQRQVVDAVFSALARGEGGTLVTANLEFLQRAAEDPALAALYEKASLRVADGMPVLWLARLRGESFPERVPGSDLVWLLAERAERERRSLYLLGGAPGAAEGAERALTARYPALRIVGASSPRVSAPPNAEELAALGRQLSNARPDIVYCAFGTPKQEQIAAALAPVLPSAWWVGCGISLSFIAGQRRRAPAWAQRLGLEWLHRASQEPRRLGGRYLLRNLPFLLRAAAGQLRAPRGPAS
jgi:N-acetylglucosaminyldiphosphoundecaprenol N-acetyl-beta-D-mannosaminyltransferase